MQPSERDPSFNHTTGHPEIGVRLTTRKEYKHVLDAIILPYWNTVVAMPRTSKSVYKPAQRRIEEIKQFQKNLQVAQYDTERSFELTPEEAEIAMVGLLNPRAQTPPDVRKMHGELAVEMQSTINTSLLPHYMQIAQEHHFKWNAARVDSLQPVSTDTTPQTPVSVAV